MIAERLQGAAEVRVEAVRQRQREGLTAGEDIAGEIVAGRDAGGGLLVVAALIGRGGLARVQHAQPLDAGLHHIGFQAQPRRRAGLAVRFHRFHPEETVHIADLERRLVALRVVQAARLAGRAADHELGAAALGHRVEHLQIVVVAGEEEIGLVAHRFFHERPPAVARQHRQDLAGHAVVVAGVAVGAVGQVGMVRQADLELRLGAADGAHRPVQLVDAVGVVGVIQVRVGEAAGDRVGVQREQRHQRRAACGLAGVLLEIAVRHDPAVRQTAVEVGVVHLEFTARVAGAVAAHIGGVVVVAQHQIERQVHRLERQLEFLFELRVVDAGDTGLVNVVTEADHEITAGPLGVVFRAQFHGTDVRHCLADRVGAVRAAAGIADGQEAHPLQHRGFRFRLRVHRGFRLLGLIGLRRGAAVAAAVAAAGGQGQAQGGGQRQSLDCPVHAISSVDALAGAGGWNSAVRRVRGREGRRPSSRNRLSPLYTATNLVLLSSICPRRSKDSMSRA